MAALAAGEDGFYPLGLNGVWHGGIHFGEGTGGTLAQSGGVHCIADGEVVAYRLDSRYQQLTYPNGNKALYSSGFTIVRHRLVIPPAPAANPPAQGNNASPQPAPAPTATPPAPPAPAANPADTLTIFSLYMHVLDWAGYQADSAERKATLPSWYKGKATYEVGAKAKNTQHPAQSSADADHAGAPAPAPAVGLNIRATPNGSRIGLLPRGAKVMIGETQGSWGKIAGIESGAPVALRAGGTVDPHATTGWVYLKELDPHTQPDPLDAVVVLDPPVPVRAGDVLGYLGEYQRAGDTTPLPPTPHRPLLHLEVFTGDDLPSFITRSRQRAAQLPKGQRTLLVISESATLCLASTPDRTIADGVKVQPRRILRRAASGSRSNRCRRRHPAVIRRRILSRPGRLCGSCVHS
jgi:hypothetical protein